MKKLSCILLTALLTLSLCFSNSYAVTKQKAIRQSQTSYRTYTSSKSEIQLLFELEKLVKENVLKDNYTIDISNMNISPDKYPYLMGEVVKLSPYLGDDFATTFKYTLSSNGNYDKVIMENIGGKSVNELKEYFSKVDSKIIELKSLVNDQMTEKEKALVIHDYFCVNSEYDKERYDNDTVPGVSYTSAGILMKNIGVCDSYAHAYQYIMNILGIECHLASSSTMHHAWNIIKIDGKYYHVDVTADDPVSDQFGLVSHEYFLLSDTEIENANQKHFGWSTDIKCPDSYVEKSYEANNNSPVIINGSDTYYIQNNKLMKKTGQDVSVILFLGFWHTVNSSEYYPNFSASGLFIKDGEIYFNTEDTIYSYSPTTRVFSTIYQLTNEELKIGRIYGIRCINGIIKYNLVSEPYSSQKNIKVVNEVLPNDITLNKTILTLNKGANETLIATISPGNATDKTLTWTSSNPTIATVKDGVVTAKAAGNAIITVTTSNGKTVTCEVTVVIPVDNVKLNKEELVLNVGSDETLTTTITPTDATNKTLTWESSNKSVATVDDGKVTAIGVGTTTITVTTSNGKTATCEVTVVIPVEKVELNKKNLTLNKDASDTLSATVSPENASDKTLTWESSNESIATVQDGKVTAIGVGTTTITVSCNGKTDTCTVNVILPITSVTLNKTTNTLNKGSNFILEATINPTDTTDDKTLTWTSSDESVATVQDGKVTAIGAGNATITVTTSNGKTATCKVEVVDIKELALNITDLTLDLSVDGKKTGQLNAEIIYNQLARNISDNSSAFPMTWKSSNTSIATVDQNGLVTGVSTGKATITVSILGGNYKATCEVTVNKSISKIEFVDIKNNQLNMVDTETKTIKLSVTPNDTNETYEWSSSNKEVATVEQDGKITALKAGETTITVKTSSGKIFNFKLVVSDHKHIAGDWIVVKNSTCTKEGQKVRKCTICKEVIETKTIDKKPHTYGAWKVTVKPTIKAKGEQERVCSVCGEKEVQVLPVVVHEDKDHKFNGKEVIIKEATCKEEGIKRIYCSIDLCEAYEEIVIPKKEHSLKDWEVTKEATCTENGVKVQKCKVCGDIINTETIPATGHQWKDWEVVMEATCTSEGSEKRICSACGEKETRVIAKVEHTLGEWEVTKKATCTETGIKVQKCTVCENTINTEVIPAIGHQWKDWEVVKEATCTSEGSEKRVCSACGEEETKVIAKAEHTLGEWEVTKDATCTENGEQIQKCVVCGSIIKTEEILAQHHFGEWEIIKEATEAQQGLKERICEVCGEKEEEIIPIKVIVDENENKDDDKIVVDDKKDQSDSKKDNVKTSDNTNIGLYGIMIGLSALSIVTLYRRKKLIH